MVEERSAPPHAAHTLLLPRGLLSSRYERFIGGDKRFMWTSIGSVIMFGQNESFYKQ